MKILRKKYDIDKQLGVCAGLTPPLGRAALKTASALMSAASPKSGGGIIVEKIDSAPCRAWLISSDDAGDGSPCLVYFHGGGWTLGRAQSKFCNDFAAGANCAVVSVDYPLAPERRFPEQPRACFEAFEYVRENAKKLGISNGKFALAGDSSGGNLALAVSIKLAEKSQKQADGLILYPWQACLSRKTASLGGNTEADSRSMPS